MANPNCKNCGAAASELELVFPFGDEREGQPNEQPELWCPSCRLYWPWRPLEGEQNG
jgi:hypothetical protein